MRDQQDQDQACDVDAHVYRGWRLVYVQPRTLHGRVGVWLALKGEERITASSFTMVIVRIDDREGR
jgi:hypothetical protein